MKNEDKVFIKVKPTRDMVLVRVEVPAKSIGGIILPHHSKFDDDLRRVLVVAIGPEVKTVAKGDRGYVHFKCGLPVEKQYRNRVTEAEAEEFMLVFEKEIYATFDYVELKEGVDPGPDVVCGLAPDKIKHLQTEKVERMEEDGRKMAGQNKIIPIPGGGLPNPLSEN